MKKRGLSILLVLIIAITTFPISSVAVSSNQYEAAWFPAPVMNLSQIAYEAWTGYGNNTGASHGRCNAIDILPGGDVFAPFTGEVVYLDANWGYVLFQSKNKVCYADGSIDYMTVAFMHDSNISNLYVGQTISQGTDFYQAGGMGNGNPDIYGSHVDISIYRGQVSTPPGKYGRGDTYAYEAFCINRDRTTKIYNAGNMEGNNYITNGGYTSYDNLWKDLADVDTGYLARCTKYPACCLIKTTDKTYAMTLPCSSKTDAESEARFPVEKGKTLAATELILNDQGNFWYRVQFPGGSTAYIPSSKTAYQYDGPGQIEITGANNPTTLTPGSTFSITGTVTSNFNHLLAVSAYVRKGHGTDGEIVTGGSAEVNDYSYSLARSSVDNQVLFNHLPEGEYTYIVEAEYINYYAVNEKKSASNTGTVVLHEAYFTVTSSSDTATPGKPILKTSVNGDHVQFSWGSTTNTTHYNVWIQKKAADGTWENVEQVFYAENGFARTLPYGEYRAQLLSYNSNAWESDGSDWRHTWADDVYFTIAECNHSYSDTVTKEPTCKAAGVRTYSCSLCGDTKTESIPKLTTHTYDNGEVIKQATCAQEGETRYTCTVCGKTKTESPPKDYTHIYDTGKVTKQPTCKEAGEKTYSCVDCGYVAGTEVIPKLTSHTYDSGKVTKQPTCKEKGVKTYTCTVCGATKTEDVAKLTTHAYDEGKVTKQPTCKEKGVKTYTCTVCGVTKTEDVAKLTTHSYDNGKVTKQPTCKTEGIKTYTCMVCGAARTENVAKVTMHNWEQEMQNSNGTITYKCSVCGKTKTEGTPTEAPTTAPAAVPTTMIPATTVPATTVAATTVPATTVPATTVAATTVPATTVPATTVAATTVPVTTAVPTTAPATTIAPTTAPVTAPEESIIPTTVPTDPAVVTTTPATTASAQEMPTTAPAKPVPVPTQPADKQNESSASVVVGAVTATGGGAAYLWFFQRELLLKLLKKLFKN